MCRLFAGHASLPSAIICMTGEVDHTFWSQNQRKKPVNWTCLLCWRHARDGQLVVWSSQGSLSARDTETQIHNTDHE